MVSSFYLVALLSSTALAAPSSPPTTPPKHDRKIHLGPRPFWLVDKMADGPLEKKLESCSEMDMKTTRFTISHRGGGTL
jgi:glycerophosphoryl diester phosphodiesterase